MKGTEIGFKNSLIKAGFMICESLKDADALVLIDMDIDLLKYAHKSAVGQLPIIFIRSEPIVVWPANYNSKAISLTSKLIDVGRHGGVSNSGIPYPQKWHQNLEFREVVSTRNEAVVLMNGNKLSFIKGEMYSTRRVCIFNLPNLDLYGTGWDISFVRKLLVFVAEFRLASKNRIWPRLSNSRRWLKQPTNWKGAPESKIETLSRYKYTLVIENSMDALTEKLFDALFARCIPVYVGPAVDKFQIPDSLVVQVEPNMISIKKGIEIASAIDYEEWKARVNTWLLQDEVFNKWSAENAYDVIANEVFKFLKNSLK
jgi:hypothetical protein